MRVEIIALGCSAGGLHALKTILGELPATFSTPIVVAQHRGPESDEGLAAHIQLHTPLAIFDGEDKMTIEPGKVYLAPPDYHLCVERGLLSLSIDPPVLHARPSIDVLFESVAESYRDGAVGVVLTGAGEDGARGLVRIKELGGLVVVQDPATAETAGLPVAALAALRQRGSGLAADHLLSLSEVGPFLRRL